MLLVTLKITKPLWLNDRISQVLFKNFLALVSFISVTILWIKFRNKPYAFLAYYANLGLILILVPFDHTETNGIAIFTQFNC